jgi:hypothetical protein
MIHLGGDFAVTAAEWVTRHHFWREATETTGGTHGTNSRKTAATYAIGGERYATNSRHTKQETHHVRRSHVYLARSPLAMGIRRHCGRRNPWLDLFTDAQITQGGQMSAKKKAECTCPVHGKRKKTATPYGVMTNELRVTQGALAALVEILEKTVGGLHMVRMAMIDLEVFGKTLFTQLKQPIAVYVQCPNCGDGYCPPIMEPESPDDYNAPPIAA